MPTHLDEKNDSFLFGVGRIALADAQRVANLFAVCERVVNVCAAEAHAVRVERAVATTEHEAATCSTTNHTIVAMSPNAFATTTKKQTLKFKSRHSTKSYSN